MGQYGQDRVTQDKVQPGKEKESGMKMFTRENEQPDLDQQYEQTNTTHKGGPVQKLDGAGNPQGKNG